MKASNYMKALSDAAMSIAAEGPDGKDMGLDEAVSAACGMILSASKSGNMIALIGNGGSAGIASHMAVDFWKNGGIKATAFNDSSLLTCLGNDFGYEFVFEKPIEVFCNKGDVLIAISSSGRSANILKGVEAARKKGMKVITMSGFGGENPLRKTGDYNFYISRKAYGPVEVLHQALCHAILDIIMIDEGKLKEEDFTS